MDTCFRYLGIPLPKWIDKCKESPSLRAQEDCMHRACCSQSAGCIYKVISTQTLRYPDICVGSLEGQGPQILRRTRTCLTQSGESPSLIFEFGDFLGCGSTCWAAALQTRTVSAARRMQTEPVYRTVYRRSCAYKNQPSALDSPWVSST